MHELLSLRFFKDFFLFLMRNGPRRTLYKRSVVPKTFSNSARFLKIFERRRRSFFTCWGQTQTTRSFNYIHSHTHKVFPLHPKAIKDFDFSFFSLFYEHEEVFPFSIFFHPSPIFRVKSHVSTTRDEARGESHPSHLQESWAVVGNDFCFDSMS